MNKTRLETETNSCKNQPGLIKHNKNSKTVTL